MPAVFDEAGLRFAYPENWKLETVTNDSQVIDVTVTTPGGGFWSIQVLPSDFSPAECLEEVLKGFEQEYDDVEKEAVQQTCGDELQLGYDVRFFCLDLLVEGRVWACRSGARTWVGHYQAVQTEFEQLSTVFQAITASLFREDLGN